HRLVVLDLDHVEDVAAVPPDPPRLHSGGAQGGVELVGDAGVLAVVVGLTALGDAGVQGDAFHGVILSAHGGGDRGGGGLGGPDGPVREQVIGDRGLEHAGAVAGLLGRHVAAVLDPHRHLE